MGQNAVVGIDLSLTGTGLAVAYDSKDMALQFDTHLVRTKGRRGDPLVARRRRLMEIRASVTNFVFRHNPRLVVIEAPSYGSRFGSAHDRSGLWWLVVESLVWDRYKVVEVPPQVRAKYATGKGNADKLEVTDAISEALGGFPLDDNDNVADAMVLACLGQRLLGKPVDGVLERKQLDALESVSLDD